MARPWIKLYTEMLHHEGITELSDSAYRRFVELLLIAGQRDRDGYVGTFKSILRACYVDVDTMTADLGELMAIEVMHQDDDGYHITDWYQWQPENTDADRARIYRAKKKAKRNNNATATTASRDASRTRHALEENRIDKKRETRARTHARKNGADAVPSASPPTTEVPEGATNHAQTFKTITGYWVGTQMQDFLQQRLGERPDWDTVGWAYEQWVSRGYNPRNLRGVLEWYDRRLADPSWVPDGAGQPAATGLDFGQLFEDYFSTIANRRRRMDGEIPQFVIDAVNEMGRSRFQQCTDKERPFLKRDFEAAARKHYKVPA